MIARIWYGTTTPENATAYEHLIRTKIFPGIHEMNVRGLRKVSLLRKPGDTEVEFATIMIFDDLDAVKAFAGADYEKAYVIPEARALLSRHDERSAHYEVVTEAGA